MSWLKVKYTVHIDNDDPLNCYFGYDTIFLEYNGHVQDFSDTGIMVGNDGLIITMHDKRRQGYVYYPASRIYSIKTEVFTQEELDKEAFDAECKQLVDEIDELWYPRAKFTRSKNAYTCQKEVTFLL